MEGFPYTVVMPTRQSSDDPTYVLRFGADVTADFKVGGILTITQSTKKFFFITAVSTFSGGNTDVTVYGGSDYDVADTASTAITAVRYSPPKMKPFDFPMDPDKWTEETSSSTIFFRTSPTNGTWYHVDSAGNGSGSVMSLVIPIGIWDVEFQVVGRASINGTSVRAMTTLSTTTNSETDAEMSATFENAGATANPLVALNTVMKRKRISLAAKTTHNVLMKADVASVGQIGIYNSFSQGVVRAICAYL